MTPLYTVSTIYCTHSGVAKPFLVSFPLFRDWHPCQETLQRDKRGEHHSRMVTNSTMDVSHLFSLSSLSSFGPSLSSCTEDKASSPSLPAGVFLHKVNIRRNGRNGQTFPPSANTCSSSLRLLLVPLRLDTAAAYTPYDTLHG